MMAWWVAPFFLDLIRQAVCIASRFDMQGLPFIADQGSRMRSSGKTMNGA
jgi:hypothetical protein